MSQDPDNDVLEADPIDAANITSFTTCIESIHETFDAFLTMDLSTIRILSVLLFVRSVYAGVVLLKSYGIVHVEGSTLGAVFAPELRAEHYLIAMVDHLAKAAGDAEQQPVAWAFRLDFVKLRAWHEKKKVQAHEPSRSAPHSPASRDTFKRQQQQYLSPFRTLVDGHIYKQ